MKKRPQNKLDVVMDIHQVMYPNPTAPKTIEETRRELYFLKLIDVIWFDGILEEHNQGQQAMYWNTEWPTEPPPDGMPGISALDVTALEWICQRLKRPIWADKRHLVKDFHPSDIFAQINSGNQ